MSIVHRPQLSVSLTIGAARGSKSVTVKDDKRLSRPLSGG